MNDEVRAEVRALVDAGPIRSEGSATEESVGEVEDMINAISSPVSDREVHELLKAFGEDDCFGLSWTLLRLIETAPGALSAEYPELSSPWVVLLRRRVQVRT